jgi:hypothetical protein
MIDPLASQPAPDRARLNFGNVARPMAAKGLTSYRYAGPYGGIAIGATDTADALREAQRSLEGEKITDIARLQRWDGERWVAAQ